MIDWTKPIQRCTDKTPVRVLCTDLKHPKYPIAVAYKMFGDEKVTTVTREGRITTSSPEFFVENVPERHKHADAIIAWANGAKIEYRSSPKNDWCGVQFPYWVPEFEYRVKPE